MKRRRVLVVLVVAQVALGACGDPDPPPTSPSSEDAPVSDDGTDVLDDGPAIADVDETSAELDAVPADSDALADIVDTGLVEPEYRMAGSIVAAQGILTDEDGEYTLYGTLGCLSGGYVKAQSDDYTLASLVGGF